MRVAHVLLPGPRPSIIRSGDDGAGHGGPVVKVIVLRAGRRWPASFGTALPRVPEVEACPPRRSGRGCSATGAAETAARRAQQFGVGFSRRSLLHAAAPYGTLAAFWRPAGGRLSFFAADKRRAAGRET